jgi:hypothetical protein
VPTSCVSYVHRTPVPATLLVDFRPKFGQRSKDQDNVPYCERCADLLVAHIANIRPMTSVLEVVR